MTKHGTDSEKNSAVVVHFANSIMQNKGNKTAGVGSDHSSLSALYPTPKTFDEQRRDRERREESRRKRLPKYPHIKIAFSGGVLLAIALLFTQSIGNMWMTGGIAGIFFSFALWLGLFGAVIWWIKYTNDIFYTFGVSVAFFWIGSNTALCMIAILCVIGWPINFTVTYSVPLFSLGYSLILVVLSKILLRHEG